MFGFNKKKAEPCFLCDGRGMVVRVRMFCRKCNVGVGGGESAYRPYDSSIRTHLGQGETCDDCDGQLSFEMISQPEKCFRCP